MKYYVDGFTLVRNPSPVGGGFTVMDENNKLLERRNVKRPNFTNNEAEILGIAWAANHAEVYNWIFTDSQCARFWALSGRAKARPDLNELLAELRNVISRKALKLIWIPREQNLAGIYNEQVKGV